MYLAIMVKNEELTIIKTLTTCLNFVDTIFMYDTGSTDNTIILVKDFCDKHKITLYLLCGIFEGYSVSRNKLLNYVESILPKDTWILLLDANDELTVGPNFNLDIIPTNMKVIMGNSYWKTGYSIICHLKIIFIKIGNKIYYEGSIHEYLKINGNVMSEDIIAKVMPDFVKLFQDRTEDESKSLLRAYSDIKLLKQDIKNNIYPGRNIYLIGRTYFNIGEYVKATKWFNKTIDFKDDITQEEKFQAHYYLSIIKKRDNNGEWILHVFDAYELLPDKLEVILFLCMYLTLTEKWNSLYTYSKKAIKISKKFNYESSLCVSYIDTDYKIYCFFYHALSCYHLNKFKKGYNSMSILTKNIQEYGDKIDSCFTSFTEVYNQIKSIYMPYDFKYTNNIVLFGGHGYTKWNATNINGPNGLGGSETVVSNLAEQLFKHYGNTHNIVVFCDTDVNIIYNNVYYFDLELYNIFTQCRNISALFVFRFVDWLRFYDNIDKVYLFLEDVIPVGSHIKLNTKLKNIICKTEWHKNTLMEILPQLKNFKHKIKIIGNGVNINRFTRSVSKEKWRFIYSSCMTRGLNNLLDIWPKIKSIIPTATLHLFVTYTCPYYKEEHGIQNMINKIANTPSIIRHDRVSQEVLAIEIMKSDIWLYPTEFTETYCITALEMQLGKVLCITNNLAGLTHTVGNRGILVDYKNDNNIYVDIIQKIANNEIKREDYIDKAYSWAIKQDWSNIGNTVAALV